MVSCALTPLSNTTSPAALLKAFIQAKSFMNFRALANCFSMTAFKSASETKTKFEKPV